MEPFEPLSTHSPGSSEGMDSCPVKRFVRIDISEPCDERLIEEEVFDPGPSCLEERSESLRIPLSGFRTQSTNSLRSLPKTRWCQGNASKPSYIAVEKTFRQTRKGKDKVGVRFQ